MKQLQRVFYCLLVMSALVLVQAQIIVPDIAVTREQLAEGSPEGGSSSVLSVTEVAAASADLRQLLERTTGMLVQAGSLSTLGMTSNLEPDITALVAEMSGGQYGVTAAFEPLEPARARLALRVQVASADGEVAASFRQTFALPSQQSALEQPVYALAVREVAADIGRFIREQNGFETARALLRSEAVAAFYVDDVWVGQGRTLELEFAPGHVAIDARAEGFLAARRELILEAAQTSVVQFALIPAASGSVQVRSVPEADIYVAGYAFGRSPATVPTAEGGHEVFVFRPGFRPETHSVDVNKFRVSRLDVTLEPITNNLLYWDAPAGFEVYINGNMRQGYLPNPSLGVLEVEMRRVGQSSAQSSRRSIRFEVVLEREGVYELDFFRRSLEPLSASTL